MGIKLNSHVSTEIGDTWVRTLSHYLFFRMPRTTIFATANPYAEETIVSIRWNISDSNDLQFLHDRLVACVEKHGFGPIKEAVQLLQSKENVKQTAGKVKLLMFLSPEVAARVAFVS